MINNIIRYQKRGKFCKGFTLIELLIALSISTIIGGATLGVSNNSTRNYFVQNELNNTISTFVKARSLAISNNSGSSYSVKIDKNKLTIFAGSVYKNNSPKNIEYTTKLVNFFPNTPEIMFNSITGFPNEKLDLNINSELHNFTFHINSAGSITRN